MELAFTRLGLGLERKKLRQNSPKRGILSRKIILLSLSKHES